jgi:hypothetical protein
MSQYMIVPYGKQRDWNKFSEEEQKDLCERYFQWTNKLRKEDRFVGGSRLTPHHRHLHSQGGKIAVDGPYPETKELLTSYFLIRAKSLEEAVEVSRGCPALAHGDSVQVFELAEPRSQQ